MNWATFLRREWGAATFVLTVLVGIVVVPLGLFLANQSPTPAVTLPTPSATASQARTASPARSTTPTPSPAVTPSHSP